MIRLRTERSSYLEFRLLAETALWGVKRRNVRLTSYLHLFLRLRMRGATPQGHHKSLCRGAYLRTRYTLHLLVFSMRVSRSDHQMPQLDARLYIQCSTQTTQHDLPGPSTQKTHWHARSVMVAVCTFVSATVLFFSSAIGCR